MDSSTRADEKLDSDSTEDNTGRISYGGAIFTGSQHFTVAGGTFTNVTKNFSAPQAVSADFARIHMGDIDLQREIWWNPHGHSRVVRFRKLYAAKIERGWSSVTRTVAVYQGHGSEEEWRCDIAKYMAVRHPNIVQLYGTASCSNMHAVVFTDDLIPFQQFANLYQHSHFATVYIRAYVDTEFYEVRDYIRAVFGHHLRNHNCTFFIRRSTGRFCTDLVPGVNPVYYTYGSTEMSQQGLKFLAGENSEATIIHNLTMHQYHSICYWGDSAIRSMSISISLPVNIGSVFNCALEHSFDDMTEIAWLPNAKLSPHVSWENGDGWGYGELMTNGWTRFDLDEARGDEFSVGLWLDRNNFWLSQAHHIFTSLQVVGNFHDYVLSHRIDFTLTISTAEVHVPGGFLFLCPPVDFQTGKCSFKWPDCPAYWSLDPSGAERLSSEDANRLGFPSFQRSTEVEGYSWGASVYAGLREFHQAKGFEPDSQDLARHLSYPLYQFSPIHALFAHIDEADSPNAFDGDDTARHEQFGSELESTPKDSDLYTASVQQDLEAVPLSRVSALVINVQLSLILFLGLVSVL